MLGRALTLNHEIAEAREILEDVLERQNTMLDLGDDRVLRTELWLAAALIDRSELLKARDLLQHVVKAGSANHRDDEWPLNPALVDLARTLCLLGRYDEELPMRVRVLTTFAAHLGPDDAVLWRQARSGRGKAGYRGLPGVYEIDRVLLEKMKQSDNVAQFVSDQVSRRERPLLDGLRGRRTENSQRSIFGDEVPLATNSSGPGSDRRAFAI